MTERDYLLALHRVLGLGPTTLGRLLDHFGSYEKTWWAPAKDLTGLLDRGQLPAFLAARDERAPETIPRDLDRAGVSTLTLLDESYPAPLRQIHAAPAVLYLKGSLPEAPMVAVVGTRGASRYGRDLALQISSGLARAGVTVVSGLAYGIDIAAHRGALDSGGTTVAVLATPLEGAGPAAHRADARRIAEQGALVTEYPPGVMPQKGLFAVRNRIIAGLCQATLVIEAPEKSGALITASHALAENREVLAVPGPVGAPGSAGTHNLIRQGAHLARDAGDVLEVLGLTRPESVMVDPPATLQERQVVEALAGPTHFDTIAERSGFSAGELGSILTLMEITGKVRHLGGSIYTK